MIRTFIRKEQIFGRDYSFYFSKDINSESFACISRIEWTQNKKDGSEPACEPLRLEPVECQNLMDALWDVGLRPSEGSGSAGALKAVQDHLKDMRALVFKTEVKI